MLRMEVEQVLVLDLVEMRQDWLELVVVERQVLRDQAGARDEEPLHFSSSSMESSRSFEDDVDDAHVVIGVQVRHVDGLQVGEDLVSPAAAKLTVKLEQSSLSAVQENEVVCRKGQNVIVTHFLF